MSPATARVNVYSIQARLKYQCFSKESPLPCTSKNADNWNFVERRL